MMKVTPNDPRLSAYVLGELSADEAAVIERAAAGDPAIKMSVRDLEKMSGFLINTFNQGAGAELLPSQREAIRKAGRDAASLGRVVKLESPGRSWKRWLGGFGAAATVAFAALLMSRVEPAGKSVDASGSGIVTDEIALLPLPGPSVGGGATQVAGISAPATEQTRNLESRPGEFLREVARHLDRRPLPDASKLPATRELGGFGGGTGTRLPVVVGDSSLRWVSGWVLEKQELPPRNAVRVEELVNASSLPIAEFIGDLGFTMETMRSPWNAKATLLAIQVKAGDVAVRDLELVCQSESRHRLLGSFAIRDDGMLPSVLPAGRSTLVMLELLETGESLGEIEVIQGSQVSLRKIPVPSNEVTPGMRHAALLGGFGMWLRDEGVGQAVLMKLLESSAGDHDPVRAEVRRMLAEALDLRDSKR